MNEQQAKAMRVATDLPRCAGHAERIAFLRERAAYFRSLKDDASMSYAADLDCEADELQGDLNHGATK